jgi:hypothetical protein
MAAVCESREAARCRAMADELRGLANELISLPKDAFRETKELVRQGSGAPCRSPNELAEVLSNLPRKSTANLEDSCGPMPTASCRHAEGRMWNEG